MQRADPQVQRRPKPGIIEGFQAEEKSGTDTGGGTVDYETENKSLFLSRTYTQAPPQPPSSRT